MMQEILAVQVIDSTTILVTMTKHSDTSSIQVRDIRVTNPDTSTSLLKDAFTVIPRLAGGRLQHRLFPLG